MAKGISLVGIKKREEAESLLSLFPGISFELSYAMNESFLEEVKDVCRGRTASVHSLCPRRAFFPNFASSDESVLSWSLSEVLEDADTAAAFGASILVLHPGYIIPFLVPSDKEERMKMMGGDALKDYIAIDRGSICTASYIHEARYREAFERMIPRLEELSSHLRERGMTLAVENLNPRAGYMLVHPDEMVELSAKTSLSFTLDIGHLYVSAERFSLDFLSSLERILSTGRVVTTHLHSNPSDRRTGVYSDSHQSLDRFSMPWKDALRMIEDSGANMILETVEDPVHNLELLFSL